MHVSDFGLAKSEIKLQNHPSINTTVPKCKLAVTGKMDVCFIVAICTGTINGRKFAYAMAFLHEGKTGMFDKLAIRYAKESPNGEYHFEDGEESNRCLVPGAFARIDNSILLEVKPILKLADRQGSLVDISTKHFKPANDESIYCYKFEIDERQSYCTKLTKTLTEDYREKLRILRYVQFFG